MLDQAVASVFENNVMFVNEFLRADRKWASNFAEN
jgi:hypothetical protein